MQSIPVAAPVTPPDALAAPLPLPPGLGSENAGHDPRQRGAGPLRGGNPRGNPNLAPRCGAKTRAGLACRAPAMGNGRRPAGQARGQAPHGGRSTGPRNAAGLAKLAAAHTTHGRYGGAAWARDRYHRTLIARTRLDRAAVWFRAYLPSDTATRLARWVHELAPPRAPHRRRSRRTRGPPGPAAHRAKPGGRLLWGRPQAPWHGTLGDGLRHGCGGKSAGGRSSGRWRGWRQPPTPPGGPQPPTPG
jgi:hypothetical protein